MTVGFLRINNSCNLSCRYCYLRHNEPAELDLALLPEITDFCQREGIQSIEIPQQEPLLNKELFQEVVEVFFDNHIRVQGITTNLVNLSQETLDLLWKYQINVLVSYDSIWHDKFRRTKTNEPTKSTVERNMERLELSEIPFSIAITVPGTECSLLYDAVVHAAKFSDSIALNFDVVSDYSLQEQDLPILEEQLRRVYRDFPHIFPFWKIQQRLKDGWQVENIACGAGRGSVTIDYDGKLYPCYHVSGWQKIGISLGDIWDGIDEEQRGKFRRYGALRQECQLCSTAICGICYVNSHLVMGNMFEPIPIECKLKRLLTRIVRDGSH